MSKIVVMTKAEGVCQACKFTKKWLDERDIPYAEIRVTADSPEFQKQYEVTGLTSMPIVFPNGLDDYTGVFAGMNVNELKKIEAEYKKA